MAITRAETQVTWPTAANDVNITTGSNATSEEFSLNQACFKAQISIQAINSGTPAAGDIVYVYLLQSNGDTNQTGGDEFDTTDPSTAVLLATLDTVSLDPDDPHTT